MQKIYSAKHIHSFSVALIICLLTFDLMAQTPEHPPGNYNIQPVDMRFDVIYFIGMNTSTMDAIFYHGHGRD